jgi:hypothetical protein
MYEQTTQKTIAAFRAGKQSAVSRYDHGDDFDILGKIQIELQDDEVWAKMKTDQLLKLVAGSFIGCRGTFANPKMCLITPNACSALARTLALRLFVMGSSSVNAWLRVPRQLVKSRAFGVTLLIVSFWPMYAKSLHTRV